MIVGMLYNTQWFPCETSQREANIFCLSATKDDMEERGDRMWWSLWAFSGHDRSDEWSRGPQDWKA